MRHAERGQALPLLALMLLAMLAMAALLFDGAQALLHRRALQNAADSAAVAAANVIQAGSTRGCNGGGGSTPRSAVLSAALTAAADNSAGYPVSSMDVTCPSGYGDTAVQVTLSGTSPAFFGGILRMSMSEAEASAWTPGLGVSASGTAMNGGVSGTRFSVVVLNPHNSGWSSSANGCPSFLISGGPTIAFGGNVHLNSACPAIDGGALGTNGNSATVTFAGSARLTMTGGFSPGPLTIVPTPITGQPVVRDPLRNLPAMPIASLPQRSSSQLNISSTRVLEPGIYRGGIRIQNNGRALLRPGIYVIENGNLDIGGGSIFSVGPTVTTTSAATWASDCPANACGALIYNTRTSGSLGQISIGAQGTMMLRPYLPSVDLNGTNASEYENLIIWQDASPTPGSSYTQPDVRLTGGGTIKLSGTVYTPSARVYMTGSSGGSGGATDLTLQFISWDLQIQGNSSFHFIFNSNAFAKPTQYGLVE
jgi:Flp pilus assembly protein TadG